MLLQSLSVPGPTDITASYDSRIQEAHKDEEGGMANNELSTVERAIKSLRKKIKSSNQQLPAWVQSKITKAADYIDTAADYMSGETEPVEEAYDDENETFRQHSRERFTAEPADDDKAQKTSRILQRMKEMNKDEKDSNDILGVFAGGFYQQEFCFRSCKLGECKRIRGQGRR